MEKRGMETSKRDFIFSCYFLCNKVLYNMPFFWNQRAKRG